MAYKEMAALYDELMAHAPYDEWVRFTEEIFAESEKEISRIVDLGCGTGEITIRFAESGYEMIGVDYSTDMLSYAQHKESQANPQIQWLHQDIRNLSGLEELDAAVSFCDVLNYITEPDEVKHVFQGVHQLLKDDGIFLFDVHDIDHIVQNYIGNTFAEVTDNISYIWFCTEGESPGEMYHDLTFFAETGGYYEKFEEQHHQRTFPVQFYKNLLKETGFENIKVYADFSLNDKNRTENNERIFFLATKTPR